jgi:hypothetical protein
MFNFPNVWKMHSGIIWEFQGMTFQGMFNKLNEGKWHTLQCHTYIFIATLNHTWAMTYVGYENEVALLESAMKVS